MSGGEVRRPRTGRALRCEEARVLLMAYIDGEIEPQEASRLEDHLAVCVDCRRDERAYRRLEEVTGEMVNEEVPRSEVEAAWDRIYWRLERTLGWALMSVGLIIVTLYGAWHFLNDFLLDPGPPLVLRIGVGVLLAGIVVLLVSIGRERWLAYKTERYREVDR